MIIIKESTNLYRNEVIVEFSKDLNSASIAVGLEKDQGISFQELKRKDIKVTDTNIEDGDIYKDTRVVLRFYNEESIDVVMRALEHLRFELILKKQFPNLEESHV